MNNKVAAAIVEQLSSIVSARKSANESRVTLCIQYLALKQKNPQGKPAVFSPPQGAIVEQLSSIVFASIEAQKQLGQLFYI